MSAEVWTVLKVLTWTKEFLSQKGVENARLESEWMLCAVLGLDRMGLYVNFDKPLTPRELADYRGLIARRGRREPLQYILGSQEFMGLEFAVTPAVLIPRHDTEVLVNEALKRAHKGSRILDIGVGSGCISIALAKALPDATVTGVDSSAEALAVAEKNRQAHGVSLELLQGSLFEPVHGRRFDLIVSNPPYIPSADLKALQPEVLDHEPVAALDGGEDGLHFYRSLVAAAPDYLAPGGWLLFEVGIGQAEAVEGLLAGGGKFTGTFTAKDAADIDRVVGGQLK
ncbi:peptide chain release factor N(5)-glutamine methyltransferase [Geotalea sp. SG265]|uniref:peptide chain release factor N(5)-glutamine methyltransferase n=1 Tax=Geotalea sp. SG265 TaxID=2922867 RepID=UPI001FAF2EC9|nr:peptide chain release factor N(5)-glutamine methyltransferase [Geotalea sp. SG265]